MCGKCVCVCVCVCKMCVCKAITLLPLLFEMSAQFNIKTFILQLLTFFL